MTEALRSVQPDVLFIGASRCGTTRLYEQVSRHAQVAECSIKEPQYFSTRYEYGPDWYRNLFGPTGIWIDASTEYSYPEYMARVFSRLSPETLRIVYAVREPIERAYSQYCHEHYYLGHIEESEFASTLRLDASPLGPSRYDTVIPFLIERVGSQRLLIVPLEVISRGSEAAETVLSWLGLDAGLEPSSFAPSALFSNQRVAFKSPAVRNLISRVRDSRAYPPIRRALGSRRIRALRGALTSSNGIPDFSEVSASFNDVTRSLLSDVRKSSRDCVDRALAEQDERLGLSWHAEAGWLSEEYIA